MKVVTRDEWTVPCRDLAGRKRHLTVLVSGERVVLIAPPGEAAVLAPLDVGRLRAVLRDAVIGVAQDDASAVDPRVAGDRSS